MPRIAVFFLGTLCLVGAEDRPIPDWEKEIRARPLEAFVIARRAADSLKDRPDQLKRLFALGARLQEDQLRVLSEEQVTELAEVHAKTLGDREGAERVQRGWLKGRRGALGPADEAGRLRLARLTWQWLRDRKEAAELCIQALAIDPDLKAAAQMLREDLDYQKTRDGGWQPRERRRSAEQPAEDGPIQRGMTASEVRDRLGPPDRVARQILFRRRLEQWTYGPPHSVRIEIDSKTGEDPQVLNVQSLSRGKR